MKLEARLRRHKRITKKIKGTAQRPRIVVFRSKKHIYVQFVNDELQRVLGGISTLSKEFREKNIKSNNIEGAKEIGRLAAQKAQKMGIRKGSFDRAGYRFHGRVKALAEGMREGGIEF